MTQHSDSNSDEQQLRDALRRTAPKPSEKHNDVVMKAARAKAAATKSSGRPQNTRIRRFAPGLGIAAAVALAVSLFWTGVEPPATSIERGSSTAVVPKDGAVLSTTPMQFEWAAAEQTARYRLKIHNDDATLIWSSDTLTSAEWVVDGQIDLENGKRYFWIIDYLDATPAKSSGPYWFTIE